MGRAYLMVLCAVDVVATVVASWSCETRLRAAFEHISNLEAENSRLQAALAASTTGCSSPEAADAEGQEWSDDAPALDHAHWHVVSGTCERNGDCISSPNFPSEHDNSEKCLINIGPGWTGVVNAKVFDAPADHWFNVVGVMHRVEDVRGLTPSTSILWEGQGTGTDLGWVLCRSNPTVAARSLSPETFWSVSAGDCEVDVDGCVTSPHFPTAVNDSHSCTISIQALWTGYIHVENFSTRDEEFLVVNDMDFDGPLDVARIQGLEGLVPTSDITWTAKSLVQGEGWKICRAPPDDDDSVPWYGTQWTCTNGGNPCLNGSVCTTQFSDTDDEDGDNNIHNGYPLCETQTEPSHTCGPCKCAPGENQDKYQFSLTGFKEQSFINCTPCAAGQFNSYEGGTCQNCPRGQFQNQTGQSLCRNCSAALNFGGNDANLWDTMESWELKTGADDVRFCGCREGAWLSGSGACVECGEGMICKGMDSLELEPGYFSSSSAPGFVWKCHGPDAGRCPGGPPGTCAENRDNRSIACGACQALTRPTDEGPCEPCASADIGWVIGASALVLLLLVLIYCAVATENLAQRKQSVTLLATLCSHTTSTLQMLNLFNLLSVAWPRSFDMILSIGALLNFNLDHLSLSCVSTVSAFMEYAGTVCGFLILIFAIVALHVSYTLVAFHRSKRRQDGFTSVLVGAVGTIFNAAFISVSAAIFAPVQCEGHPNGQLTLHAFPQIVCWSEDYGPAHRHMVMLAGVASLLPLSFLSICTWAVFSLPSRIRAGDTVFLHTYAFLFYRFRPGTYWYALVVLLRNLCVALVPVLLDEALQVLSLTLSFLLCVVLGSAMRPWAAREANYVDIVTNMGFVLILVLAAMSTEYVDEAFVGSLLLAVFLFVMSIFVCVAAYGGAFLIVRHCGKTYQFFLCHHKDGAGAFARILKMRLQSDPRVTRQVFLDSDNLRDLKVLFGVVGNETRTLLVLCSREILSRCWCVGEMTTARLHGVDTILVLFPDFDWPSNEFVSSYAECVQEVTSLAQYGISESLVQTTLQWLPLLPVILLPQTMSLACVDAVVSKLLSRRSPRHEMTDQRLEHQIPELRDATQASEVVVVVDHTNWKAECAAVIVELLLKAHFPMLALPRPQDDLPEITKKVLVICSNGCFMRPVFVKQLFQARALGVGVIPVIAETSFQFPTHAWYEELTDVSHLGGLTYASTDLTFIVKRIFQEIAVHMEVQDSEHALQVRGEAIAKRLSFGSLRPLSDDADLPSKSHSVASLTPAPQSSTVTSDITDQSVTVDLESITLEFFEPQEAGEPCPTITHVEEITDAPEYQELAQHSSRWSAEEETVLGEGKANHVRSFHVGRHFLWFSNLDISSAFSDPS